MDESFKAAESVTSERLLLWPFLGGPPAKTRMAYKMGWDRFGDPVGYDGNRNLTPLLVRSYASSSSSSGCIRASTTASGKRLIVRTPFLPHFLTARTRVLA